jgi:O-antigen ligase
MNPYWRERIVAVGAALMAVWLAFDLAQGAIMMPLLVVAIALAAILTRMTGVGVDVIVISFLWMGYVIGNRGFAQLMPVPGVPLLPAEIGLAIATSCLLWRCARDKRLPWHRDSLNYALLAWMLVGTARVIFDFPHDGILALRDYATVYYVAFFFIVQQFAQDERTRHFLLKSLFVTSACLPVVFTLFELFPEFFLGKLLIRGVPLVFFKGDLAPTFLTVASILLFLTSPHQHRWWARPLAVVMLVWVFAGDNRASMLGAVVALAWLLRSRFRRFAIVQASVLAAALLVLVTVAGIGHHPWAVDRVRSMTERIISVVDISGHFSYQQEASISKTGNNQFRWVWWQTIAEETMSTNPALGLGFGYDLARGFLQEYNPELAEDFTARSPHNIFVTVLGRMGLVGFALFGWAVALIFLLTWRVVREPDADATSVALSVSVWPILISSCLGVVLEGPMGAVVFWSLLGLANGYQSSLSAREPAATKAFELLEVDPSSALATAPRRAT